MIPVKLRLCGFLSYREPVTIDFSNFDLACISGHNGAGKSSLLDALTWALFGQARRTDDAVINNNADTAEVSLEFEYEGNYYRVLRSKPRDKTTILEFNLRDDSGQWKVLTEPTFSKTQERIRRILRMDYETFTNASFFLQGKADQFAQQRPADRKRILSNILGLEIWETYKDGASTRRKSQERELASVEGQLREIDAELAEEGTRRENLARLDARLKELSENRATREKYLAELVKWSTELEHDRRRLIDLESQLRTAVQRRDQRAIQLAERRKEQSKYQDQAAHAGEIEADYQQLQAARQQLEQLGKIEARYNAFQQDRSPLTAAIQSEKVRLETERDHLRKRKNDAETAQLDLEKINRDLDRSKSQSGRLSESVQRRDMLREQLEELKQVKAALEQESRTLQTERAELVERIEHLEAASEGVCPLCESELGPEELSNLIEKLKVQEREAAEKTKNNAAHIKANQKELGDISGQLNQMTGLDQQVRQEQQRLFTLEAQRTHNQQVLSEWQQNYSAKLMEIEKALAEEAYAAEAHLRLAELDGQMAALGYDPSAHEAARQRELALRSSEARLRDLDKARSALEPLSRQIIDMQSELAADEADIASRQASFDLQQEQYESKAAALPDVVSLQQELDQSKEEENIKRIEVGGARQKVEVLKHLKARRDELTASRSEINQQIARLKILERAFGKDGVPALLIEQALPEIESQTNTFLDRLSNGTMSVRFLSQREYKDSKREDKKETLDIMISDPAGMREYEMFSGGEAFRVNFAIRLALSRVLARRAGARLQTLVIDEGFGSQDADGRQRLIEAINLVRPDFAKIIVITHLDELKDAFPTRIEVEKAAGGSSVRVLLA